MEVVGLGPGPFAGMLLSDLGADVQAIQRPAATIGTLSKDVCLRGKRRVTLDLKSEEGKLSLLSRAKEADILFEGNRPGVMERLGLGPEACWEENPALVYGRITGWGQDGPLSARAGHDLNYAAMAGAIYSMGKEGQPPPVPLNLVADYGGGALFLVVGLLAALRESQATGVGQVVDASMTEGASLLMALFHSLRQSGLWSQDRGGNFLDGGAHFYRCYETSDGQYISLAAIEPQFMANFIELAGLDPSMLESHLDQEKWPTFTEQLSALFKTKTRDEWCELLEGSDCCFAPVLPFWKARTHPHHQARNSFIGESGEPAPAPRFIRRAGGRCRTR